MKVLVMAWGFPNARRPVHGMFTLERTKALARLCEIRVVAPVKWFPFGHRLSPGTRARVPRHEVQAGLDVYHPKYFAIPYVLRFLDGFLYFLSVVRAVRKIRREFPFELIDAHFAFPDGFAAVLLGKLFNTPVVVTLHGGIGFHARYAIRRQLLRYSLRHADRIVSVSDSTKAQAVALGIRSDKIALANNGIDASVFHPHPTAQARTELGLPQDRRVVISVGHLREGKGFDAVIELFPQLLARFPDLLFVVVGGATYGGRYMLKLERLVEAMKLHDHVRLAGTQLHDRVPLWLSAADVFCLMTRAEAWATVFLEAMACGIPVVTTRVGGNAEVVASDDVGILVPGNDPEGMVRAIAEALDRRWDREKIRRYALQHTWDRVAERVFTVWTEVVGDAR